MKLEVVVVPVSDIDRAKQFYKALGWREDADFLGDDGFHLVQLTPPGSTCSIHFGTGIPSGTPGSAQMIGRGVNVSEVFHDAAGGLSLRADPEQRASGPDPDRRSYASYATFRDPDGNGWVLQELTTRLPGR